MKTAAAQLEAPIQEFRKLLLNKEDKFAHHQHALPKEFGVPKDSCYTRNSHTSSTITA